MEVRAKKALGQHFLTDQSIAQRIVEALETCGAAGVTADGNAASGAAGVIAESVAAEGIAPACPVLEVGPGMGVLSQYLMEREDIDLKMIEIDRESVDYLLTHFPKAYGRVLEGDFLKLKMEAIYKDRPFCVIGNFPYNISSQIFFKILQYRNQVPQVVCMIQKEVAERIAEKPGSKTYGILSVLLQAWYDIEYLFSVGQGAFAPPPKVMSAVIRLRRNSRANLGCDEALFKTVVKTAFGQRRKTLRNSLKSLIAERSAALGRPITTEGPVWDLRPERLGVEDFISLTRLFE